MPSPVLPGQDVANDNTVKRLEHNRRVTTGTWHGRAYLIESILLLAFIVGAITVFFQLFSYSEGIATANESLSDAVVYAANAAELFASDPAGMDGWSSDEEGMHVACSVEPRETSAGTLYNATITVTDEGGEVLYTLSSTAYVSAGRPGADGIGSDGLEAGELEQLEGEPGAEVEGSDESPSADGSANGSAGGSSSNSSSTESEVAQ